MVKSGKPKKELKKILHYISRLLQLVGDHKRLGIANILIGTVGGLLGLFTSWLSGQMLDMALEKNVRLLFQLAAVLFACMVIDSFLHYYQIRIVGKFRIMCGRTLRKTAGRKVNNLSMSYYEDNHTGSTVTRLISDIDKLEEFYVTFVNRICSSMPTRLFGAMILVLILNIRLGLICLIILPVLAYLISRITLKLSSLTKSVQDETDKYNSLLRDYIEGVHIYKSYNMKDSFDPVFEEACTAVSDKSITASKTRETAAAFSILGQILPRLFVYIAGGIFVARGELTVGALFIFSQVIGPVIYSFEELAKGWTVITESSGRAEHFFELLDADEERDSGGDYFDDTRRTIIEFENVSFAYHKGISVLKDVSFTVEKGQKVAIVGASGSGKSTIQKLFIGHYENYGGKINIYGHELSEWNPYSLRKHISAVTQNVYLFCDTIRENIRYGNLNADDNEVIEAAKKSCAHEFIMGLEDGYDTVVGERGSKLSGGQCQRLAIARTILKNSPVLLLDEPTSALDTKAEYYVQEAIESLEEEKTVVIIAHRLSTIINADKIVVLNNGEVVETGCHEELIENNGRYRELYERQLLESEEVAS